MSVQSNTLIKNEKVRSVRLDSFKAFDLVLGSTVCGVWMCDGVMVWIYDGVMVCVCVCDGICVHCDGAYAYVSCNFSNITCRGIVVGSSERILAITPAYIQCMHVRALTRVYISLCINISSHNHTNIYSLSIDLQLTT